MYQPLDNRKNEIRLLRLAPSSDIGSVISGTLHHVPIDQHSPYEALSYTWTDDRVDDAEYDSDNDQDHFILLDGHYFSVARNLFVALRQLRLPSKERLFWVDAICINQSDLVERSDQVSIMKAIYVGATRVVSWIGEEYENSNAAFKFFHILPQYGGVEKWYETVYKISNDPSADSEATAIIEAVMLLFNRRYWSRVWVLQELAFARDIAVTCGPDSISWAALQAICAMFQNAEYFLDYVFGGSHIGHRIFDLRKAGPNTMERFDDAGDHELLSLGALLAKHRHKFATDPGDKAYSLLGMASNVTPQNFVVDYRLETSQIYRDTAIFLIQNEQTLSFLGENKPPPSHSWLPSWVPDWTNANNTMSQPIALHGPFSASGTLTASDTIVNAANNSISVRGICIGRIATAGVQLGGLDPHILDFLPVFSLLYEWWKMYISTGRDAICGRGSFVDIVTYGLWYSKLDEAQLAQSTEWFLKNFAICLKRYEHDFPPLDATLQALIDQEERPAEGFVLRRAESEIWETTPRCRDRKFFVSGGNEIGLAPQCTQEGDLVVVVLGCEVPVVLRQVKGSVGQYVNLGDVYVHGFMGGEAVKGLESGRYKLQAFEIC